MRILVTGRAGQVAASLVEVGANHPELEIIAIGRPELELTERTSVLRSITALRPDVVVSAAAYTAVDRAEDEPELAHAINVNGAAAVAEAAAQLGAPVIHLSTDYVFSGDSRSPYCEDDEPLPNTVYGTTKLAGEKAVAKTNANHVILRTSWIYSPFGTNFVKTMLRLARDRDTISVVADQWGNPTCALNIAEALLQIAPKIDGESTGIYHFSGAGETNWAGFARHVLSVSRDIGGPFAEVTDIATADYPAKARRPANSRLSCAKVQHTFGVHTADWRSSSADVVRRLIAGECEG